MPCNLLIVLVDWTNKPKSLNVCSIALPFYILYDASEVILSPLKSLLKSCILRISPSSLFLMAFSKASLLEDDFTRFSYASETRWISVSTCKNKKNKKGKIVRKVGAWWKDGLKTYMQILNDNFPQSFIDGQET